jgi:hypothetical protein
MNVGFAARAPSIVEKDMAGALRYLSLRALLLLAGGFLALVVFGQPAEAAAPDLTGALVDVPSLDRVTAQTLDLPATQTSKPAELITAAGQATGSATEVAAADDPGQAGSLPAMVERLTPTAGKSGRSATPVDKVPARAATPITKAATEPVTEPVTKAVTKAVTEPVTKVVTKPVTKVVTEPVTKAVTKAATPKLIGDVAGSIDGLTTTARGSAGRLVGAAVPVALLLGPVTGLVGGAVEAVAPAASVNGLVGGAVEAVAPAASVNGLVSRAIEPVAPVYDRTLGPVTSATGATPADAAPPVDGALAPLGGTQESGLEPEAARLGPLLVPAAGMVGPAAGPAAPRTLFTPMRPAVAGSPLPGGAWRSGPTAGGSPSAGGRAAVLPVPPSAPLPASSLATSDAAMMLSGRGRAGGHGTSDAAVLAVLMLLPLWLRVHMRRTCLLFSSAVGLPLDRPG